MPNHIKNKLTVFGDDPEVRRLVRRARGKMPKPGDFGTHHWTDSEPEVEDFCFHRLVPLPKEFTQNPYGDGSPRSGQRLEVATWGVKWGAYDQKPPEVEQCIATYSFTTAWEAPIKFLAKVSPKWKGLTFLLSYGGEGPIRGRATFRGKRWRQDDDGRGNTWPDRPKEEDYPDDNDYYDADLSCRELRLRTHHLWAASEVAKAAGMDFGDDLEPLHDWLAERGMPLLAAR